MCSFDASPLPSATQKRPGNMAPSVAIACATIAGWYRWPGAFTAPNGSDVVASAAPRNDQPNPDCPWRSLHGEKWSDDIAAPKPAASASRACARRRLGGICSCEQCRP